MYIFIILVLLYSGCIQYYCCFIKWFKRFYITSPQSCAPLGSLHATCTDAKVSGACVVQI